MRTLGVAAPGIFSALWRTEVLGGLRLGRFRFSVHCAARHPLMYLRLNGFRRFSIFLPPFFRLFSVFQPCFKEAFFGNWNRLGDL